MTRQKHPPPVRFVRLGMGHVGRPTPHPDPRATALAEWLVAVAIAVLLGAVMVGLTVGLGLVRLP